ncbi:MAG: cyclic nucleotide-binding domain-containing protein [Desulfovermiculus sp.]
MILESLLLSALVYGLISAATLPLGAIIGVVWRLPDQVMSFLLSFGGGALLAALTIDLVAPGVDRGHFGEVAAGAMLGGLLFKLLDYIVDFKGGYLRKPSTAMTYWRHHADKRLRSVLRSLHRTELLKDLSPETEKRLLSIMLVREFPANFCIYRADDPATNLYIIEDGEVELCDPKSGGQVFRQLGKHAVFGRMSFITGLHRASEAYTVSAARLLVIPREAFMDLLDSSPELREVLAERLKSEAVSTYLQNNKGLSSEQVAAWREYALKSLAERGRYDPPIQKDYVCEDLLALMKNDKHLDFFSGLSDRTLQQIANYLIHKTSPQGYNFYHMGQHADRLYFLRQGSVYLFDPEDRSRKPTIINAGDSFGAFAFLTEGAHSATAVCLEEAQVSVLRHKDFVLLLDEIPELRKHLSNFLRRNQVAEYLTSHQNLDAKKAANWMHKASKSLEVGKGFPSLTEMTKKVAGHKGAAMAMYLGILLDGIPESLVIGANVMLTGGISISLLGGLFAANLPEAMSSAAGMKEQGMKNFRILAMWISLMLMTGIGAAFGSMVLQGAPDKVFALIEGIAAGAMLTMVAETMLPEAFHKGGSIVGISTLAGFLVAIYFNTL